MTLGPIDFVALEFPGNKFTGEILTELFDLVDKEIIHIYDLVVVLKEQDGSVVVRELQELDPQNIKVFEPAQGRNQPDAHVRRYQCRSPRSWRPTAPQG